MLQAAVMSLGLIGAGTNNAQIAGMLRNLSSYYYKDASLVFCVMLLLNSLYFSIQYFIEFFFLKKKIKMMELDRKSVV